LLPGSGPPYPAPVSYITRLSDVTAVTRDIRKTRDAGLYSGMIQNTHEVNNGLGTSTHTVRVPGDDGESTAQVVACSSNGNGSCRWCREGEHPWGGR
jgi:hypothetical protein